LLKKERTCSTKPGELHRLFWSPERTLLSNLTVNKEDFGIMLYWVVVFLVVAIIAGLLGFGGIAGAATDVARVLFFVFLVLLVIGLIAGRAIL